MDADSYDTQDSLARPGTNSARNTRVIVISDLHLGGVPPMMSLPSKLASFIDHLPMRLAADETLELVIAGDFVDFLAISPYSDITLEPGEAVKKLSTVMNSGSTFAVIFDALGRFVARRHRLTVLIGNHDVELTLPAVQESLFERLNTSPHHVHLVDDGRAYRIGGALIEHGNAYDGANANDWNGLRHLASAQSRARKPEINVEPSPGSQLVRRVVNELKGRYPFLGLLQPEGELLALILLEFEPSLRSDFGKIGRLLNARKLAARPPTPGKRPISDRTSKYQQLDRALLAAFGNDYESLVFPIDGNISTTTEWLRSWVVPKSDSLSEILKQGREIPTERLARLRLAFQKLLRDDDTDRLDGPVEQYGIEAERMISSIAGLDVVVMGHTHLPRYRRYGEGTYINSGTWVDRFRVPSAVTQDSTEAQMAVFLGQLLRSDGIVTLSPTFADLAITEAGRVARAELLTFTGGIP